MDRVALTKITDAQLIKQIASKNEQAFEELYRRYSARLYRYFKRMSGSVQQAEDLLQDLFMRLIQKAHLFDEKYSFSTWIYTIAYHVFVNQVRKKNVVVEYEPEHYDRVLDKWDTVEFNSDVRIDQEILRNKIEQYLLKIDLDKRHTFILRYQEDRNISEIAEIMGCPQGTVKSRLHYILKKLEPQLLAYKDI